MLIVVGKLLTNFLILPSSSISKTFTLYDDEISYNLKEVTNKALTLKKENKYTNKNK